MKTGLDVDTGDSVMRSSVMTDMECPDCISKLSDIVDHTSTSVQTPKVVITDINSRITQEIGDEYTFDAEFNGITGNVLLYDITDHSDAFARKYGKNTLRIGLEYWLETSNLDIITSVEQRHNHLIAKGISLDALLREIKRRDLGKRFYGITDMRLPDEVDTYVEYFQYVVDNIDEYDIEKSVSEQRQEERKSGGSATTRNDDRFKDNPDTKYST